jgi:hypothetical protein
MEPQATAAMGATLADKPFQSEEEVGMEEVVAEVVVMVEAFRVVVVAAVDIPEAMEGVKYTVRAAAAAALI